MIALIAMAAASSVITSTDDRMGAIVDSLCPLATKKALQGQSPKQVSSWLEDISKNMGLDLNARQVVYYACSEYMHGYLDGKKQTGTDPTPGKPSP